VGRLDAAARAGKTTLNAALGLYDLMVSQEKSLSEPPDPGRS
jgi:hypothetical protein